MPTSAAGNNGPHGQRAAGRHTGFTLLELIVVVAIIALATAGVGLAMRDPDAAALAREADRLAALLESARAQSRTSGTVVNWRPTPRGPDGFAFDGLLPGALPTTWLMEGVTAQPSDAGGRPAATLQLGPEPIIAAQQVLLSTGGPTAHSVRISTDGLRPFVVTTP